MQVGVHGIDFPLERASTAPSVSMRLLWPFLAVMRARGRNVDAFLDFFELPWSEAMAKEGVLAHATVNAMLEWLTRADGDAIALRAASALHFAPKDLLDYAALSSSSFRGYVETYNRYAHVLVRNARLESEMVGDDLVYVCRPEPGVTLHPAAADFATASMVFRCLESCSPSPRVRQIELQRPRPGRPEAYEKYFGAPVLFGRAESCVIFEVKTARPTHADAALHAVLCEQLEQVARAKATIDTITGRVRNVVQSTLSDGKITSSQVAKSLALSRSQLRHLLRTEGTSFQRIVDDARRELAFTHLREPRTNVEEVAERVGFSHVNGFIKAFQRWTGETPGQYRKRSLVRA